MFLTEDAGKKNRYKKKNWIHTDKSVSIYSMGKYDQRQQLAKRPVKAKKQMNNIKNEGRLSWEYNNVRINLSFTNKVENCLQGESTVSQPKR